VVWHQAVSENADAGLTAVFSEQIEVDTPVSFGLVGCGRRLGSRFRVGSRVGEIRAGRAGLSVAYFAVVVWWENFFQRFCGRGRSVCPTPFFNVFAGEADQSVPHPSSIAQEKNRFCHKWPLRTRLAFEYCEYLPCVRRRQTAREFSSSGTAIRCM
jgi:hypothetical protein